MKTGKDKQLNELIEEEINIYKESFRESLN
jgi:hypothetical protein